MKVAIVLRYYLKQDLLVSSPIESILLKIVQPELDGTVCHDKALRLKPAGRSEGTVDTSRGDGGLRMSCTSGDQESTRRKGFRAPSTHHCT